MAGFYRDLNSSFLGLEAEIRREIEEKGRKL